VGQKCGDMGGIVSIDWRPHNRRAKSMAKDLGARLYLAPHRLRRKSQAPIRYIYLSLWTTAVLLKTRPRIVIASSPPSFCPLIVYAYAKLFGARYIVDSHHLATVGYWAKIPFGFRFNKWIMNAAMMTLVHNRCLSVVAKGQGIRAMVLETRIPDVSQENTKVPENAFSILVPCSFDADEPIEEVYGAAEQLEDTVFYVSGSVSRLSRTLRGKGPRNVIFTGFLPELEYDVLLNSVDAVLALTSEEYPVRPRGASEAIGAEKPLIVSRNDATEIYLQKGSILISNRREEIVEAVLEIRGSYEKYRSEMRGVREERAAEYRVQLGKLIEVIKGKDNGETGSYGF